MLTSNSGKGGGGLARAHVRPQRLVALDDRVRDGADLVLEVGLGGLVGHLEAGAGCVEFPAVVVAGEAGVLVAAKEERCAAVRAVLGEQAHVAVGVAEGDEVLAQQADALHGAVALRQVAGRQKRDPELADEGAHRRSGPDSRQHLIVVGRQHAFPLIRSIWFPNAVGYANSLGVVKQGRAGVRRAAATGSTCADHIDLGQSRVRTRSCLAAAASRPPWAGAS